MDRITGSEGFPFLFFFCFFVGLIETCEKGKQKETKGILLREEGEEKRRIFRTFDEQTR